MRSKLISDYLNLGIFFGENVDNAVGPTEASLGWVETVGRRLIWLQCIIFF